MTLRIATWSGPRNISTALMRAWESRSDCAVVDEPFYAYWLRSTGTAHPGRDAILASQPQDWRDVVSQLMESPDGGAPIVYQKHMAHHLLPEVDRDWLLSHENVLLVRDPARVAVSFHKVFPNPGLEALGYPQQRELFRFLAERTGRPPLVLDSARVLADPERELRRLCAHVGAPWDPSMLSWRAGPRESDGVWAEHWYGAVERSTGFLARPEREVVVPPELRAVVEQARGIYEELLGSR